MFNRATMYLLLVLGLMLSACSSGDDTSIFNITGLVTEAGTATASTPLGTPLEGVTVTLGTKTFTTLQDGAFEFRDVGAGTHEIGASLAGYNEKSVSVTAGQAQEVNLQLSSSGGRIHATGALQAALDELDGSESDGTTVTLSGDISDFALPSELVAVNSTSSYGTEAIRPSTTAITINTLQALVNGVVYDFHVAGNGSFGQRVPINPGPNTIQLRVFSSEGAAYTTSPIVVTVTLDQLDMRVLLRWDTTGSSDVDLHMFKRAPGEPNPTADSEGAPGAWWDRDRHVDWRNKTPTDFGNDSQNPFLDIDDTQGYGPETIVLQDASSGEYHIWVHFFNKGADPVTNAVVEVTLNEQGRDAPMIRSFEKTLTEDWEFWYVTTVSLPEGTFIDVQPAEGAALSSSDMQFPAKQTD